MLWPWISELRILGGTGVDDKHKADFKSDSARDAFFLGKTLGSPANLDSYTQLNTEIPIRVNGSYEDLLAADMVTFLNRNLGNKRIYARIIEKQWVNTNCTLLRVEIDAYTTFMNDIKIGACFVEREMQSGDWMGGAPSFINVVPEPFHLNAHTASDSKFIEFGGLPHIIMGVTTEPDGKSPVPGEIIGNIYTGCKLYASPNASFIDNMIAQYANNGNLDSIVGVWMAPFDITRTSSVVLPGPGIPTTCEGYKPANAKLLTYPYTYLEISTINGTNIKLDYALFDDPSNPQFEITAIPLPTPGATLVPLNYRGLEKDYDNGLWCESNVQCCWAGNSYANWVGSQAMATGVKIALGMTAAAIIATTAGTATPLVAGMTAAVSGGAAYAGAGAVAAAKPSVARGMASGDGVPYTLERLGFQFNAMTPTSQEARRIDGAFNGIGYATQTTKVPNVRTRSKWNYVKTMNATVEGSLTASWISQIEQMLNSGVTFWHIDNGATIGNYSGGNG